MSRRAVARQPLHQRPSDVLDHATSEIAVGIKLGIDATKKLAGEGFNAPLIKMDEAMKAKVEKLFKPLKATWESEHYWGASPSCLSTN